MNASGVKGTSAIHCGPATTVAEALRLMEAAHVHYLVVVEGGRTLGLITPESLTSYGSGTKLDRRDSVGRALGEPGIWTYRERRA